MNYVTQYLYKYKLEPDVYLIMNTLTGAVDVVEKKLADQLKPKKPFHPEGVSLEEQKMLMNHGYLLTENDEKEQVKAWFDEYKRRMKAFHFIVCPTFTCNLRCPYCYEGLDIRSSKIAMSPEMVEHMFHSMDTLISEREATQVNLQFFGGEPFLRHNKDVVENVITRASSRGWLISGITNGTQIHNFFPIFERYPEQIDQIQITMDGPEEIHNQLRIHADGRGSYQMICKNVTGLLELEIPVLLRVNTGTDNVDHLPRMFDEFEKLGWTKSNHFLIQIAPINDHSCTGCVPNYQPEFKLLTRLHELFPDWEAARDRYRAVLGYDMERRTSLLRHAIFGKESFTLRESGIDLSGCSASKHHYVVYGAEGLIYACPETVGVADAAIGKYSPAHEINREKWNKWDLNISNTSKCSDCNIAPVCGGACPWHGFNSSSFDAYEPHCNFAQQTISKYLDLNKHRILEAIYD